VPVPVADRSGVSEVEVIVRFDPKTLLLTVTVPTIGGIPKLSPAFATLPRTEKLGFTMQYSFQLHGPQFDDEGPRSTALMLKLH